MTITKLTASILIAIFVLTGCASKPPKAPECKGEWRSLSPDFKYKKGSIKSVRDITHTANGGSENHA